MSSFHSTKTKKNKGKKFFFPIFFLYSLQFFSSNFFFQSFFKFFAKTPFPHFHEYFFEVSATLTNAFKPLQLWPSKRLATFNRFFSCLFECFAFRPRAFWGNSFPASVAPRFTSPLESRVALIRSCIRTRSFTALAEFHLAKCFCSSAFYSPLLVSLRLPHFATLAPANVSRTL